MSLTDYLSLYAIVAIWGLMFLNIFLSIGGFIYMMKVNKTDGRIPLKEYPMVGKTYGIEIDINEQACDGENFLTSNLQIGRLYSDDNYLFVNGFMESLDDDGMLFLRISSDCLLMIESNYSQQRDIWLKGKFKLSNVKIF